MPDKRGSVHFWRMRKSPLQKQHGIICPTVRRFLASAGRFRFCAQANRWLEAGNPTGANGNCWGDCLGRRISEMRARSGHGFDCIRTKAPRCAGSPNQSTGCSRMWPLVPNLANDQAFIRCPCLAIDRSSDNARSHRTTNSPASAALPNGIPDDRRA